MGFRHGALMASVVLLLVPGVAASQAGSSSFLSARTDRLGGLSAEGFHSGTGAVGGAADTATDLRAVEDLGLACGPVLVLEREWYGVRVTDERQVDEQFLAPVEALSLLAEDALARVGVRGLPGLPPAIPAEVVDGVVDVALRLAWHEEYQDWDTYVDRVTVGLDRDALAYLRSAGSPTGQWRLVDASFACGPAATGITWESDPRAEGVEASCLTCPVEPQDGWRFTDVLRADARLAQAEDYSQLPPGCLSVDLQPQEVVAAAEERLADLEATLAELQGQLALKPGVVL